MFPKISTELKGIQGELGEMKISLNIDAKPVMHWPYRLNPHIKQKLKKEIDHMLSTWLIFLVYESKQISPIVIERKKYT